MDETPEPPTEPAVPVEPVAPLKPHTLTSNAAAQYWLKLGARVEMMCQVRGVPYWRLWVADDDERMKDPAFLEIAEKDWARIPETIYGRMWAPLYSVKSKNQAALTFVGEFKCVPIAREPDHIQKMFDIKPKYPMQGVFRLDDMWRIIDFLKAAKNDGAVKVMDILSVSGSGYQELLDIDQVISLLERHIPKRKDKQA